MTTLTVTYTTMTIEDDQQHYDETCYDITIMADVAERLLDKGTSGIAVKRIESILQSVEMLKGRHYVQGSIKGYTDTK